jgi:hypothetical protein
MTIRPFEYFRRFVAPDLHVGVVANASNTRRSIPLHFDDLVPNALKAAFEVGDVHTRRLAAETFRNTSKFNEDVLAAARRAAFDDDDCVVRGLVWWAIAVHWQTGIAREMILTQFIQEFRARFGLVENDFSTRFVVCWLDGIVHALHSATLWSQLPSTEASLARLVLHPEFAIELRTLISNPTLLSDFIADASSTKRIVALLFAKKTGRLAMIGIDYIRSMALNDIDGDVRVMAASCCVESC